MQQNHEWDGTFEGFMSSGPKYNALFSARPQLLEPDQPGEHVWVLLATYRVSTQALADSNGGPIIMDAENLATSDIGCWTCAVRWSERQDDRVCPGNPAVQIKNALAAMLGSGEVPPCTGCDSPLCPDCRKAA